MNTIKTTTASVIGARHARVGRNGQDATAAWSGVVAKKEPDSFSRRCTEIWSDSFSRSDAGGRASACSAAVVVVCDGCSSGAASEVGARLGAKLFARAVGARLESGESPSDPAMWADARAEVVAQLGALADQMARGACVTSAPNDVVGIAGDVRAGAIDDVLGVAGAMTGARGDVVGVAGAMTGARGDVVGVAGDARAAGAAAFAEVVREHLLFTVVAAAVRGDEAAVWALGDGVYSFGYYARQLGPFADNAPPYLGYDLLGDARPAHFEVVCLRRGTRGGGVDAIVVGTDGAAEIIGGIERFAGRRYVEHADALRRELAILAKPQERIDWDARRVVRTPAMLQDDCAIGVLRIEREAVATSLVVVEASS